MIVVGGGAANWAGAVALLVTGLYC